MKSFSTYIAESTDKEYAQFLKDYALIHSYFDGYSMQIDELEDYVYSGKIKHVQAFFKKFEKPLARMVEFANKDHAGRWKIECKDANKLANKYGVCKERYAKYAEVYQKVLGLVSKGDKQDDAINALVKTGASIRYYDLEQGKLTVPFFSDISKDDILAQIDRYKGMVQIAGAMDLHIIFANGRVKKVYF